jgi:hypothetical protein
VRLIATAKLTALCIRSSRTEGPTFTEYELCAPSAVAMDPGSFEGIIGDRLPI